MNRGGAETMVMNYYRNIDKSKIQFDFLVHRKERGAYDDEIEAMGGRIYRMIPIYPQNFVKYKQMLKEFFDQHDEYKIVHSHMSELGYFALQEAKRKHVPNRIVHAHNAPSTYDYKYIVRWYFKKRIAALTTHRMMCGQSSGIWLFGKKHISEFIQMNNAIDAKHFTYNKEISYKIKSDLGLSNSFVIGHVGRFDEQKNHVFLIEIFKEVHDRNKNAVLLLVGDGKLRNSIKAKADKLGLTDSVIFTGVRSDVPSLFQAMDVFLFPSLYEGLGIVAVEAQAAGLHTIVSDKIPQEAFITKLIEAVPLTKSKEIWAEKILKNQRGYERRDTYNEICHAGYDVKVNVKWLENFYVNLITLNNGPKEPPARSFRAALPDK